MIYNGVSIDLVFAQTYLETVKPLTEQEIISKEILFDLVGAKAQNSFNGRRVSSKILDLIGINRR